ncbi:MAG: glycosyltransferase family 2 protein [Myxococcota bacterium]
MSRVESVPLDSALASASAPASASASAPGPRYVAGIVQYGSDPGLRECLRSLREQSLRPVGIIVVDHDGGDAAPAELKEEAADVLWWGGPNAGYAAGANRILALAEERWPEAEYVLVLNPDIVLDSNYAEGLAAACEADESAALAGGKLMRPGAELIDSAGIRMDSARRFRDRGSEEADRGAYASLEPVEAVSGAALWLRRASLPTLSLGGEIFDEDFFSYHEDTDLAWRARLLGFRVLYVPGAVAIHRRGWQRDKRNRVPENIRRHSFKNRYLEMIKNDRLGAILRDLPAILAMESARLFFALFADRAVLPGYFEAVRLSGRAWRKRRILRNRIEQSRIEKG